MRVLPLLFLLVALPGCGAIADDECFNPPSSRPAATRAHPESPALATMTLDDELVAIVETVPGFGGFYFGGLNGTGNLHIYLLEPDQQAAEAARGLLAGIFDSAVFTNARVVPVQGQYDYRQLYDWRDIVSGLATPHGGWTTRDIDESQNRLIFGVETQAALDALKSQIEASSVPIDAVLLEITGPITNYLGSECTRFEG
ncbi:MAG: hypothetical protein SH809_16335 [Rhodothermales bacterium]|nr:hypothetical protein [Rhodothermales bacterium]